MKILVTGASGFVGQLLAEHLLAAGHHVVLADIVDPSIPATAKHKENATCIKADLFETPGAVLSQDLDVIYAFHGIMSAGSEENFDLGYRANLYSTLRLLEATRNICPGVRFIFSSSIAVLGQPLPAAPSETTMPTPQTCYGTQKAMIELAINDYTRRGFINGFVVRLPTISVRPGKPTQAASSWVSGIIREPLQGKGSVLPVRDDFRVWVCSPRTLVKNLLHILTLDIACMPLHIRQVQLPGITITAKEMLDALEEVGGGKALALVKRESADAQTLAMLDSWPFTFDVTKALDLGFSEDQSFAGAVRDFAASLE